ncbi:hypothetical protein SAMN04487950_0384 [Halogranum rubrum]|uniref:DUF8163 domain-containing protein n=2 Tax=Halogranum rubrum TaxID=553466 RepID=A0A1I4B8E2_9EURY|nr:hypothetical protein SAMN04487950_0384 [Halogranum rubrum]
MAAVWLAGPIALVFVGVLGLGVVVLSSPFAFALGQVLLLGLPTDGAVIAIVIVECGLCCILLSEYSLLDNSGRYQLGTVMALAILGGIGVAALVLSEQLWVVAAVWTALIAFVAYGLHRVELVQLNLVRQET